MRIEVGVGFGDCGLGFRVWVLGFRGWGSGFDLGAGNKRIVR